MILSEDRFHAYQCACRGAAQLAAAGMGLVAHIGVALHHRIDRLAPGKTGNSFFHTMDQGNFGGPAHRIGANCRQWRQLFLWIGSSSGVPTLRIDRADRLKDTCAEK